MTHTPFGGDAPHVAARRGGPAASSRLDHELAAFAANLDLAAFKALSPGIGLGEPRAVLQRAFAPAQQGVQHVRPSQQSVVHEGVARRATVMPLDPAMGKVMKPKKQKKAKAPKEPKQSTMRVRTMPFERRLVAWSIDFLFVLTSIATALALATVLAAVRKGDGSDWLSQAPLQWLAQFKALELLGGVYGAFLAYFVLFKGLAGASVGEAMLGGRRRGSTAKQAVSPAP